jgi:signal transduction histidine kinase
MAESDELFRRLLDVGESLMSELDPEVVLTRILDEARRLTGARYAALGILDPQREALERFVTAGIDSATRRRIGELPHGRGVLGVLIRNPQPLRLSDVGAHPESYGFPPEHPPMRTFLGVPILIGGTAWGNLYLTEKANGGDFTDADEEAAVALARWAVIAIENARIHQAGEQQRHRLEYVMRALEASRDITDAMGSVADLERVLELIAKRGRALIGARSLLIMVREGDHLTVAAAAGHVVGARGRRLPIRGSTSGQVLERGRPQRVSDVAHELRINPARYGVRGATTAMLVPMLHRGVSIGVLAAFDHGASAGEFSEEDERLLREYAQSAANAVAIKRSVEADRVRTTIAAADAERARWARELHDETLQSLGGLRVLLASTVACGEAAVKDAAMREAIGDIEREIANLREIISDLRPSLLDDLGLGAAIEALLERRRGDELEIDCELTLPETDSGGLSHELETTVYRLVQESLTNVVKHARARHVRVSLGIDGEDLLVAVEDDGRGFDVAARPGGFGLAGMRERVDLAGGVLDLASGEHGTRVLARLPVPRRGVVLQLLRNE